MIKPTVGRVVWFYERATNKVLTGQMTSNGPLAAIVTHVHSDTMVNLAVFAPDGTTHPRTSATLVQPDGDHGGASYWCEWMPYQVGQAKRHESDAEAKNRRAQALEG